MLRLSVDACHALKQSQTCDFRGRRAKWQSANVTLLFEANQMIDRGKASRETRIWNETSVEWEAPGRRPPPAHAGLLLSHAYIFYLCLVITNGGSFGQRSWSAGVAAKGGTPTTLLPREVLPRLPAPSSWSDPCSTPWSYPYQPTRPLSPGEEGGHCGFQLLRSHRGLSASQVGRSYGATPTAATIARGSKERRCGSRVAQPTLECRKPNEQEWQRGGVPCSKGLGGRWVMRWRSSMARASGTWSICIRSPYPRWGGEGGGRFPHSCTREGFSAQWVLPTTGR